MMRLLDYIVYIMDKNTWIYNASYLMSTCIVLYMGIIYWILILIVGFEYLKLSSFLIFVALGALEVIAMYWIYTIKDRQSDAIARYYNNHPSRWKMIFHLILFFILPFAIMTVLLPITKWVGENGGSFIKIIFG